MYQHRLDFMGWLQQAPHFSSTIVIKLICNIHFTIFCKKKNLPVHGKSRWNVGQTYTVEELRGQPQVVVQSQECHSLQPHHDDLEMGNEKQ